MKRSHANIAIGITCIVMFVSILIPWRAPEAITDIAGPQITLLGPDAFWHTAAYNDERLAASLQYGCAAVVDDGSPKEKTVHGFPAPAIRYTVKKPCHYDGPYGFSVLVVGAIINIVFYATILFFLLRARKAP